MLNNMNRFDENKMAELWMEHVNGRDVFPKLPVQLKKYQRYWERNRRVQDAMDRAKSDIDLLSSFVSLQVPMGLETNPEIPVEQDMTMENAPVDEDDSGIAAIMDVDSEETIDGAQEQEQGQQAGEANQHTGNTTGTVTTRAPSRTLLEQHGLNIERPLIPWITPMQGFATYMQQRMQAPYFPAVLPLPFPLNCKRPADALPIAVAGETITALTGFHADPLRKSRGQRGKGKGTRKAPSCKTCSKSPNPDVRNSAGECPGRYTRRKCPNK
jgi:hypothetical protein